MRKIKLFVVHDHYVSDGYGDDDYRESRLSHGVSEWEEVSDEDFQYIRDNLYLIKQRHSTGQIVMVEQKPETIPEIIKGIKATIDKQKRDEEKRREIEKQKREEAATKRAAKKLERDKKALAKLIEQNPDLIKSLASEHDERGWQPK